MYVCMYVYVMYVMYVMCVMYVVCSLPTGASCSGGREGERVDSVRLGVTSCDYSLRFVF